MTAVDADGHRRRLAERLDAASATADVDELIRVAAAFADADCRWAAAEVVHDVLALAPARTDVHIEVAAIYRRLGWVEAADLHHALVARYSRIVDRADLLDHLAERASHAGDVAGLIDVAARHARQGRINPALEACYEALRIAPGDPDVHLQLARIRLALGWRRLVVGDLDRLARLLQLTEDARGRARLDAFLAFELDGR